MSALDDLPLFSVADVGPLRPGNADEARFWEYHRSNPIIYEALRSLSLEALAAGMKNMGLRCLWERMRWRFDVEVKLVDGGPKLNNDFAPFYARLLMRRERELAGFFEIRERETEPPHDPRALAAGGAA